MLDRDEMVVRLYDVRDLAVPTPQFPGEDVNLDPTGERTTVEEAPTVEDSRFPASWGDVQACRIGTAPGPQTSDTAPPVATWKRSQIVPNTSRLRVGDTETLPQDSFEAAVRVDGARARVVLDCVFRNDRDRALEGTFELRLPDGASPWYFAFGEGVQVAPTGAAAGSPIAPQPFVGDAAAAAAAIGPEGILSARAATWSAPKEARMVPRERAAWAYTETTRRRVDPALMEWSGGGVFSARVFPLAAGTSHRIVVGYDLDLVVAGDDLELRLDLPTDVRQRAATISVADGAATMVTPAVPSHASDARTVFAIRNPAEDTIALRVASPGAVLLEGMDDAAGPCFAVTFRPALPDAAPSGGSARAVFLVDTSLSSNAERFPVWLRLVREILERNRETTREFAVLYFDVQTRWWQQRFVANTPENVAAFLEHADQVALEGATDLGAALSEGSRPSWEFAGDRVARHDLFLLSDGAATWGTADLDEMDATLARGHQRALFAYRTGLAGTDTTTLEHLARESGGAVSSVVGEADVAAAATAHTRRGFRLRGVAVDGGSDLLVAGRPTTIHAGQTLKLVGRGAPPENARIVLSLEQDGRTLDVTTAPPRVLRSDLAARTYGEVAVAQIEEFGDLPVSPARAYATHFRVVGATCSLLMLETDDDYRRFDIRPEADAGRVRAELASAFVAEASERSRREATDPRANLVAWLHRMETTPGVKFRATRELLDAIARMPASSFEVATAPLAVRALRWTDVPGTLQEELASGEPTYDAVSAESTRRLASSDASGALRALSSLVEQRPGDTALARDVGFSALEWGFAGHAYHVLRRVAQARPFEPETYRALAETLGCAGNADLAIVWSEVALGGEWDLRFGAFRRVAAMDYARLLRRIARGAAATSVADFAAVRAAEIEKEIGVADPGLVVVVTWNTDRTDVDLRVTDPADEECSYQHTTTKLGGSITRDVTQGYGPEMFVLPEPAAGDYRIDVQYFASDSNRASLRSKVQVTIHERWGTEDERVTRKVAALRVGRQTETVATVHVDGP